VDGIVRGMHYIPNTQTILVCSENGDFGRIELQSDSSKEETKVKNLFRVESNVNRMRFFMEDNKCAAGGKENELSVWDINTSKNIWKARNVFIRINSAS
jgi:WD40 repeat protein